jgi:hypothetical protein
MNQTEQICEALRAAYQAINASLSGAPSLVLDTKAHELIEQALATEPVQPTPLVRLTDAEIFSVWSSHCENTKTKGGFNPCIFGHDVIDAMIEKNKGGSYENKS